MSGVASRGASACRTAKDVGGIWHAALASAIRAARRAAVKTDATSLFAAVNMAGGIVSARPNRRIRFHGNVTKK
jgi:hypothetical protein